MKKLSLPKSAHATVPERSVEEEVLPAPNKTAKTKTAKPAKIASSWSMIKVALGDYFADWKSYMKVAAAGAIPIALLNLANTSATDASTGAYISLLELVMNIAIIWAVKERVKSGMVPDVRHSYYDGSVAIVRFIIVSLFLVGVLLVGAGLGSAVYVFGEELLANFTINPFEFLFFALAALILALPSIYWLTRRSLALFIVVADGARPVRAWKQAQRITARRFWRVLGHLLSLAVYLFVIAIPSMAVLFVFSLMGQSVIGGTLFQIAATLTVTPIAYIYLVRLTVALQDTTRTAAEAKA